MSSRRLDAAGQRIDPKVRGDDAGLQYGGATLELACGFMGALSGRGAGSGRAPGAPFQGVTAVYRTLTELPRVSVTLTDSASGEVIAAHVRVRRWGVAKNRLAQGILRIPEDVDAYLSRASRLVRRQVRRAQSSGVACRRLQAPAERAELVDQMTPKIADMPRWVDTIPDRPDDDWWVASASDGTPLGFAIVVVDTEWALLELLRCIDHPARYLLHHQIVASLAARGLRYLLTDSPMVLRMDPQLRQLQRMLGYEVANLSLA
jgi:hypothetical protein